MNSAIDTGRIVQMMHDVHLAVAVSFFEPTNDSQFIVDYSDMKPHRNGEPRLQATHMDCLYTLMNRRGGVDYALSTATCPHEGLLRIVFTKFETAREVLK